MPSVVPALKSGAGGLAGSPDDELVKGMKPEVEGCGGAGLAGGLSSDFGGGALPRVKGGVEPPGGGPKSDACLLAASLAGSEDVRGGANDRVGGLAST